MGKNRNRNRNKNRAKKAQGAGGGDGETSKRLGKDSNQDGTNQTSLNVDKTCRGGTKTWVAEEQKDVKEPGETGAGDVRVAAIAEARTGNSKAKRDSVISSTSEGRADQVQVAAQVDPRPGRSFRIRLWLWLWRSWPCRLLRWTCRFLLVLVRIDWNDQRRAADLLLTVGLAGSVMFGVYLVVDFVVRHWGELMAVFPPEWFLVRHGWLKGKLNQATDRLKDMWASLVCLLGWEAVPGIRVKV